VKVLTLAKAELKKIFLRPIMLVMFFVFVAALSLMTVTFKPQKRNNTTVVFTDTTVQTTYNRFLNGSSENSKNQLDNMLIEQKNLILEFLAKVESENQINVLTERIAQTQSALFVELPPAILAYNANQNSTTASAVEAAYANVKNKSMSVTNYLQSELSNQITFYISQQDYDKLFDFFNRITNNIPNTFTMPEQQYVSVYEFLSENFSFSSISYIVQKAQTLPITAENINPILEKYYHKILDPNDIFNQQAKLNKLFADIRQFVIENGDSAEKDDIDKLNQFFSQYKSIVVMSKTILQNQFLLLKGGDKPDDELRNYIGFEKYNSYELKQATHYNAHLLDNELFDYEYLQPFSFGVNSGSHTNAFDFVVYAMQILSFIIAIFCMFIASGTIANEQANGTMKMIAIRPYSRSKIVAGKLLACLNFMFILLLLGFASTFAVGYISYGFTQTQVLLIFNAQTVFELNAFAVLGIYFISLYLKLAFYIALAMLMSVLAKSNTVALIFSMLLYVFSLVGNAMLVTYNWFVYLPIAHLDLFRYFGTVTQNGGFFGFNFPLNASFNTSLLYLAGSLFVFFITSIIVFKKRNIA
jgi:ABC-2 type transport system permease protein